MSTIKKILNNNAIISVEKDQEVILIGKGIGFQKKVNEKVDENLIEKSFIRNNNFYTKLSQLFSEVSHQYIIAVNDIFKLAETKLKKTLNDDLYFNLLTHCQFAVERNLRGIPIINNLFYEIKRFYKVEYEIGLEAVKILNNEFKTSLNQEEATFIAIYLIDAEYEHDSQKVVKMTETIEAIIKIIKYKLRIEQNSKNENDFVKLINHLREIIVEKIYEINKDENLDSFEAEFNLLKEREINVSECIKEIVNYVMYTNNYALSINDQFYLLVHILKIKSHS